MKGKALPPDGTCRLALEGGCGRVLWGAFLIWLLATSPARVEADYRSARQAAASSAFAPSTPHPAVVRVVAQERNSFSNGSGTLVAVRGEQGLVVTNWHVIRDSTGEIEVTFPDGSRGRAQVAKVDRDWDLAALIIPRPSTTPVEISREAPQIGDVLHIAGYGRGDYRLASGRCTQYVSPGTNHPYEMVEVSVQARNGDSGGPIFNEQGQLAGVLFGAGSGSTSGSYCGRVRWFLETVWPQLGSDSWGATAAAPPAATFQPVSRGPAQDTTLVPVQPLPQTAATNPAVAAEPVTPLDSPGWESSPAPAVRSAELPPESRPLALDHSRISVPVEPRRTSVAGVAGPAAEPIRLADLIGDTPLEKFKSLLAGIGCLAVWIWLSRTLSGEG